MLRTHVDDHRLVVGQLDVDVGGVDGHTFGQPEDGPDLAAQLVGSCAVATGQLLGPLRRLGHDPPRLPGLVPLVELLAGDRGGDHGVRMRSTGGVGVGAGRSSSRPRSFLELHRHPPDAVVLAQRMPLPVLGHRIRVMSGWSEKTMPNRSKASRSMASTPG